MGYSVTLLTGYPESPDCVIFSCRKFRRTMPPRTRTRPQPAVSTTANSDLTTLTATVRRPRRNTSSGPSPRPRVIAPPAQVELTPHPRVRAPIGPHPAPNENPVFLETNPIGSGTSFRENVDSSAPSSGEPAVPTINLKSPLRSHTRQHVEPAAEARTSGSRARFMGRDGISSVSPRARERPTCSRR